MTSGDGEILYDVAPDDFGHWAELHKLRHRCFESMEAQIDPPSSLHRMTPEDLRDKAHEESLVVVRCGSDLIGCGYLKLTDDAVYLGKLAVDPRVRRRGVLRSIVAIAEPLSLRTDRSRLELETRIELVENHATFAALDFVKSTERTHAGYNRPTTVVMRNELA